MNQILASLSNRKSTRIFESGTVEPAIKEQLIDAALQAPTAGNMTLYSIIDVTDQKIKERLSVTCDNQPFIATAPIVLIFLADYRRWLRSFEISGANPRSLGIGDLMLSFSDACIAAQNVVVAAEALGLGSCYIGDILEQCEIHRALLGLPDGCMPACMLVIGYPAESQKSRIKPTRVNARYIVGENRIAEVSDQELRDAYVDQQERSGKQVYRPFEQYMQAFCERKYNSEFSKEMTRSVAKYLYDFCNCVS